MQFITPEWAAEYAEAWNNDNQITKKLRKFSSIFKYSISDREDLEPMVIEVENGIVTSYGPPELYENIEFEVSADTKTWKKAFQSEDSIKKILKLDGFNFKGPKFKALSNKSGLERCIALMLDMDDVVV
jgi:hypothetical protein